MIKSSIALIFISLMLAGSSILSSCTREWRKGTVSGVISIYDPDNPEDKTPIKGIRVHLVDMEYRVDSADYALNEAAVIAEGTTDSNGRYRIRKVPEGNFALVPVPDTIMHRFELDGAETERITMTEEAPEIMVDFKAPKLLESNTFEINIAVINRAFGGHVTIQRPVFLFNLYPTYNNFMTGGIVSFEEKEFTIHPEYGILGYLYVVSNNFRVSAFNSSGKWIFTRWIANNYFDTPETANWEIDWKKQTITRID